MSLQRAWQKRHVAEGLCMKCNDARVNSQHCQYHLDYQAGMMRRKRLALAYAQVMARYAVAQQRRGEYAS